jgi:hypothetical protein
MSDEQMKEPPAAESSKDPAKAFGLDVGTSRIVVAHQAGKEYRFQSELNAFVTLPLTNLTRTALDREHIPHTVIGQEIVVYGKESEKMADLFRTETRRTMARGFINPSEPQGLVVLREVLAAMMGPAKRKGQKVYFSVPGKGADANGSLTYHEAAVQEAIASLGYAAHSIPEGLAVVYSELLDANCTGIGVSCGGGCSNVCLAYLAAPVFSFSMPKAGDFIDASVAHATGEVATRVRTLKETGFHFNGSQPDRIYHAMNIYYDDMIRGLVDSIAEAIRSIGRLPKLDRAIPLAISGGTAMPAGFRDRFERVLRTTDFPIPVSEVRLAAEPLHSTAKGALLAALSEP